VCLPPLPSYHSSIPCPLHPLVPPNICQMYPNSIHITALLVEYKTSTGRTNRGVTTSWLKTLQKRVNNGTVYLPYSVFIGQVWASPTLVCSMLSFVSTIHTSDCTSWLAQLVTHIMYHHCHHVCLSSCPIPSPPSSKHVQQWDPALVSPTDGEGQNSCWDSWWKTHCLAPPMFCCLAHACPTIFCIHVVIYHRII